MNGRFIDGVFLLNSDQSYAQPRTSSPVLMHLYEQAGIQIAWSGGTTIDADTALGGVASSLIVQDITYTAVTRGVDGDDIEIAYVDGVALSVAVVGTVITVTLETGVSTATLVKAAIDGSAPASALISCVISGTAGDVQVAAAAAPLAGGVDSAVDVDANTITITGHAFETGLKVGVSSSATLPNPLSATDYYVIKIDADTFKLATSMALAVAGTAVNLTNQGSSGATITFTPAATAGTFAIEASNNYSSAYGTGTWSALTFSPSLTAVSGSSGDFLVTLSVYPYSWIRLVYTPTAGDVDIVATISAKG